MIFLYRCLESENELKKLKDVQMKERRKLDDVHGALQELGRENQSLQVQYPI